MSHTDRLRDHALIMLTVKRLARILDRAGYSHATVLLREMATDLSVHEYGAVKFVDEVRRSVSVILPDTDVKSETGQ